MLVERMGFGRCSIEFEHGLQTLVGLGRKKQLHFAARFRSATAFLKVCFKEKPSHTDVLNGLNPVEKLETHLRRF